MRPTSTPHAHLTPRPVRALPNALAGTDGGFTEVCVHERLPKIVASVIDTNELDATAVSGLRALAQESRDGSTSIIHPLPAGDQWNRYVWAFEGATWMQAPWWFVEHYFYRKMLNIVRYWYVGRIRCLGANSNVLCAVLCCAMLCCAV